MTDKDCICKGNWRNIVKQHESLLDNIYVSTRGRYKGKEYRFFGIVHASDDYYYGLYDVNTREVILLSCVGDIKGFGFEEKVFDD